MNKKVDSKKLFRILVVAMIAVIIILGGTYAWIRIGLSASNTNIIKAGALDLVVDESPTDGAEVRLERAIPQSYRQGITNQPYRFTLKNNSTIATDYTISLEDFYEGADASLTDDDKIADNLIRYILVKNDDELVATNSKLLSTGRTIDAGTIAGKTGSEATAIPYTLYIWIDSMAGEDGTEADIMSKVFNARLGITAEQHHVASSPATTNDLYVYSRDKISQKSEGVTDPNQLEYNSYLKYELTNNEIAAGTVPKACVYTATTGEVCLEAADNSVINQNIANFCGFDSSSPEWTITREDNIDVFWSNSSNTKEMMIGEKQIAYLGTRCTDKVNRVVLSADNSNSAFSVGDYNEVFSNEHYCHVDPNNYTDYDAICR